MSYPGSKAFSRTEISKWSLMGRHHLVLLSHPEFHKAQCFDLSCSWYTSMTCPQEFPLQYDILLMIVYCTESYETNRLRRHYRQILIIYRNGKENGKWFLTQTSATHPDHQQVKGHTDFLQQSQTLNETSKAKYLGVTLDNTLSWNSRIDSDEKGQSDYSLPP